MLFKDGAGKKRILSLKETLDSLCSEMDNPTNNDAFFGRVDCLLTEMEDLVDNFKNTK